MNYIKIYLDELESLKEELQKYPNRLEYYRKCDTFIGPEDSISYLRKKLNRD